MSSKKKIWISIAAFALAFVLGVALFVYNSQTPSSLLQAKSDDDFIMLRETDAGEDLQEIGETSSSVSSSVKIEFPVYITGEVKEPGVYHVQEGSYIYELIELAGGFTEDAAEESINLAGKLSESIHIHIITKDEFENRSIEYLSSDTHVNNSGLNNLVNINTANVSELSSLPGIGEAYANRIINYREENGLFTNIEDIKLVPGIKDSKYSQLRDLIRV